MNDERELKKIIVYEVCVFLCRSGGGMLKWWWSRVLAWMLHLFCIRQGAQARSPPGVGSAASLACSCFPYTVPMEDDKTQDWEGARRGKKGISSWEQLSDMGAPPWQENASVSVFFCPVSGIPSVHNDSVLRVSLSRKNIFSLPTPCSWANADLSLHGRQGFSFATAWTTATCKFLSSCCREGHSPEHCSAGMFLGWVSSDPKTGTSPLGNN